MNKQLNLCLQKQAIERHGFYMRLKEKNKKLTAVLVALAEVAVSMYVGGLDTYAAEGSMTQAEAKEIVSTYKVTDAVPSYQEYLAMYQDAAAPDVTVEIPGGDYVVYMEGDVEVEPEVYTDYEGAKGESVLTTENGYIEYQVEVPETGLYQLQVEYYPVEGKNSEIQRSFFVDGELPYGELSLVEFSRIWSTDIAQESFAAGVMNVVWPKDSQGNDLKPTSVEIPEWTVADLHDNNGYITDPLCIYLTEGSHTISINSQREPMLIGKLILTNKEEVKSYAEVKAAWDENGGGVYNRCKCRDPGGKRKESLLTDALSQAGSVITCYLSFQSQGAVKQHYWW